MTARVMIFFAMLFFMTLSGLTSCGPRSSTAPPPARIGEPVVRVRIARGVNAAEIKSTQNYTLTVVRDRPEAMTLSGSVSVKLVGDTWEVGDHRIAEARKIAIDFHGSEQSLLSFNGQLYPGRFRLIAIDDDRFDVINHVAMEHYLPGVLDRELYSNWEPATFEAQAIAARTYALHRIIELGPGRTFDVESTQASQAYGGWTENPRAREAVIATRGIVLTYGGKIFPAYYSSTTGQAGQSASEAFGGSEQIPPLQALSLPKWDRDSPHNTWGPVNRDRQAFTKRLVAWGQAHGHAVASLDRLISIRIAERNQHGRPIRILITDAAGKNDELRAEQFRHAANYSVPGLPAITRDQLIKSSHFQLSIEQDQIIFRNGSGFGHGVGMSQFGAQAMARAGYDAMAILDTYYPRSRTDRAY